MTLQPIKPESVTILMVDDNPANIAAARARGWDAHLFTDAKALEAQLKASGLF